MRIDNLFPYPYLKMNAYKWVVYVATPKYRNMPIAASGSKVIFGLPSLEYWPSIRIPCFCFCRFDMKETIVLRSMFVVGMHHHSSRRGLQIEEGYTIETEPGNRYDPLAIVVKNRDEGPSPTTVGYLCRRQAHQLFPILEKYASGKAMIRIKGELEIRDRRQGPRQRGNVGFRVEKEIYGTVAEALEQRGLHVSLPANKRKEWQYQS